MTDLAKETWTLKRHVHPHSGLDCFSIQVDGIDIQSTDEARLRLAAAAPKMLRALRELTFRASLPPEDEWVQDDAIKAIIEAQG